MVASLLVEVEKIGKGLEKKGVNLSKFISLRHPKTKKMPIYKVKVEGADHFVYSDKELAALAGKDNENTEKNFTELFEAEEITEMVAKLEKLGLDISTYSADLESEKPLPSKGKEALKKPRHYTGLLTRKKKMIFLRLSRYLLT